MKNVFLFIISMSLTILLLSSCAKYDYHSEIEITDETETLDMHHNDTAI